jgi:toxin FitB
MFLLDTNVISERRKGAKADPGVAEFIDRLEHELFLPVQAIGELRSGVERLRIRHDHAQALRLEAWLESILSDASLRILAFDTACATVWGKLMGMNDQHAVDRQIAAIAIVYGLTLVTRNTAHFADTGVKLLNPFTADAPPGSPVIQRS